MNAAGAFDSGCLTREEEWFYGLTVVWVVLAVYLALRSRRLYHYECSPSFDLSCTVLTIYGVSFVIYAVMFGLATDDADDPADGRFAEERCNKIFILLNSSAMGQRYTLGGFFWFLHVVDFVYRVYSATLLAPEFGSFWRRTANPPDDPPTQTLATTDNEEIEMLPLLGDGEPTEVSPIRRWPSSSPFRSRAAAGLGCGSSPPTSTASGLFNDMA